MGKKKCNAESSSACAPRLGSAQRPKEENTKDKKSQRPVSTAEEIFWPEGLNPLPHQLEGVDWVLKDSLEKFKKYLAADAGLGKTIMAALILNKLQQKAPTKAFYVCPPFLTSNTSAEFAKWCFNPQLHLLPDSMIWKEKTLEEMKNALALWPGERILFIDEAHRFKNETTKRSKALFKEILPYFDRVIAMSGTPLPNSRPKEIWPFLKHLAPEIFGKNFFRFALKYCGAFKTDFGWDFNGFTNRKEFKARCQRSFMLRQKKEILKLPPKMEGLLTVGEGLPPVVSKVEREILAAYSPEDLIQGKIAAENNAVSLHLATYLRLLGEYKVKHAIPYIESLLEETEENLLIFGVHKETIAKLQYALADYKPLVITGEVPKEKRQDLVKTFQESKAHRVFIGNIQACGVGFTLTKATRVLFVEFSWVDGDNSQASDRAHRIGQNQSVLVQYVVLKDSIDRTRMEVLLKKRRLSI